VFAAACRTADVAPPELRRPIETLPAGARARPPWPPDLQKHPGSTSETLQLGDVVAQWPLLAEVWQDSDLVHVRDAWRDLEKRSGVDLKQDVC
jgi:hypothetical protein